MSKEKNGKAKRMDRRQFIKTSAVAAGAAAISVTGLPLLTSPAFAAKRDHILIGRPNPSTGPIADFGAATPWVDDRVLAKINADGGIFIEEVGKKLPVKVKIMDTESNPTKAAELTSRLIMQDKVDLMVAFHTPDTVNPVTSICERFKMPCITLDAPLEPWLEGGPYKWSFHAFWSVEKDILPTYVGMWEQIPTNKVVGVLMANDPDGVSWSAIFKKVLEPKGYKFVDMGRFPYGTQDYSSFINAWKKENVEILLGNTIPPDFATAWRQCRRFGFKPKVATIAKAILFPSAVGALGGDLPDGLGTEVWWSPHHPFNSSLEGVSAKDLCADWMKDKNQEWTQPIGYKYAGYEIAANVLNRTRSLDKEKIRKAIADTKMDTIVGPIKYNDQNYSRTPLVGGQWVKGDKYPWKIDIVYNKQHPQIPMTGKFKPLA
jgi:branched-chain amino acid transport system substrate-binding protein